ncbi:MAG: hypothetical protein KDC00_04680 [Flavobacteriales bacterium]|nr:hypothetical protein [Flavobacteriales bacterium]
MDLKGVIADQLGHFSPYDIPEVLFVLLTSALFGYVAAVFGAREQGEEARRMALWAGVAALATALVRSQLPIAVLMLAIAVLVGKRASSARDDGLFFSVLVIGVGCGSGATVVVGSAMIPFLLIMRWALKPGRDK